MSRGHVFKYFLFVVVFLAYFALSNIKSQVTDLAIKKCNPKFLRRLVCNRHRLIENYHKVQILVVNEHQVDDGRGFVMIIVVAVLAAAVAVAVVVVVVVAVAVAAAEVLCYDHMYPNRKINLN
uniref:Transmembrane protein n=1 Tax=Glossina brevipalpis TaxID=37001 RepID=A0A1A9WPI8_9MUSC